MDSIKKVNKICKSVKNLTEEDLTAMLDMAKEQIEYVHPFKMATAPKLNDIGEHNLRVTEALRNLKIVIESYNP